MYMPLLIVATVAYAVQNTLIGGLVRKHDLGVVITWRGLSLLVVMAPLLWFAAPGGLARLGGVWGWALMACALAGVANACAALAVQRLPVGIANALTQGLSALCTLALAMLFLGEQPGGSQLAWIAAVLGSVAFLGAASGRGEKPVRRADVLIGLGAGLGFGLSMSAALLALKKVTEGSDPFVAAWAWEGGIGLCCLAALLLRRGVKTAAPVAAPKAVLARIALCSSPTVLGTGCYTYATTLGGIGVASAVLATIMVVAAVCAWLFWRERLTLVQWVAIAAACASVVGLSLAGK